MAKLFASQLDKLQDADVVNIRAQSSINHLLKTYRQDGQKIAKQGEQRALTIFHLAAERVPAYQDFLYKNNIQHKKIKTIQDFQNVPIIDKKNYLRAYPLRDLCWDGVMSPNHILSSSSGSTGQPFLWPRGLKQDQEGAVVFETIFVDVFDLKNKSTLYIDCFAMGTWIAGPFTLACAQQLTQKGYNILTVTPGIDQEVTYGLFQNLAPLFDQIVLSGYPPFIKDLLDGGLAHDIDWTQHTIKFLFAAEGFSEEWREHVQLLVGSKEGLFNVINMYGSADAAILAHETPLTTAIRQYIYQQNKNEDLFGSNRTPTLAQYDPRMKYIEQIEGKVIFTTNAGLPLVRYSIGDEGGAVPYAEFMAKMSSIGFNPNEVLKNKIWQLPFTWVFGRSDLTVSLYGLLIYPEHIKFGLEKSEIMSKISGKFVLSIEQDTNFDPYLLVRIELLAGIQGDKDLEKAIQNAIFKGLMEVNSEYARLHQEMGESVLPVVELIDQGNQEYFKPGTKQKWVRRS